MSEETPGEGKLVWMDLEMTGLDVDTDTIIEIATLITDDDLNEIATGPTLAIHTSEDQLATMDDWNQKHHAESGLLPRVRESEVTLIEAEARTLAFLEQHVAPNASPLCGNSIWQDRRFLARHMPTLENYLHYRLIDVSTVKELARRWHPTAYTTFTKRNTHRALDDIRESIAELAHYRRSFLRDPSLLDA